MRTLGTLLGALAWLSSACAGSQMTLTGELIYGISNRIHRLDLETGEDQILLEDVGFGVDVHLTKIDEDRFLFANYGDDIIREYDRRTGAIRRIGEGFNPTYISERRKLVFYRGLGGVADPGARLYVADVDRLEETAQQIGAHLGRLFGEPVVQVSADEVVFLARDDGKNHLYLYNIRTDELRRLDIQPPGRKLPSLWRSATQQLLLWFGEGEQFHYLTDLVGSPIERLPINPDVSPELYLPARDAMLAMNCGIKLRQFWRGEMCDLWLYEFKARKASVLHESMGFGKGGMLWFEQ